MFVFVCVCARVHIHPYYQCTHLFYVHMQRSMYCLCVVGFFCTCACIHTGMRLFVHVCNTQFYKTLNPQPMLRPLTVKAVGLMTCRMCEYWLTWHHAHRERTEPEPRVNLGVDSAQLCHYGFWIVGNCRAAVSASCVSVASRWHRRDLSN